MLCHLKASTRSLRGGLTPTLSRLSSSSSSSSSYDLFCPSEEHKMLRDTVRNFVEQEVDPQALRFNR